MDLGPELECDGQKRRGCLPHRCGRAVLAHVLPVPIAVLPLEGGHVHVNDANNLAASKEEAGLRESRNAAGRRRNRAGLASV